MFIRMMDWRRKNMNKNYNIDVVVKGVLQYKDKVLIIKRSRHDVVGAGTWECPGGKIEFGEDLEDALRREVLEEVGINITVSKLLYASTLITSQKRQVVFITYLCKCKDHKVTLSGEHEDYKWCSWEQLHRFFPSTIIKDFEKNNVFTELC
jgi:8-oxo-dGTP diphosphatase